MNFWKAISHTSETLSERFQQEFSENGDFLLQYLEIYLENTHQLICSGCNLDIQEKLWLAHGGDSNVCGQCIENVIQSNLSLCPTCGHKIENVIRVHQM